MRSEWVRVAWSRGRDAVRRIVAQTLEAARNPRRLLLLTSIMTLLAFGVPITVAGAGRIARGVGAWRSDAGADWHRTRGRVVAVRDDAALSVRVRYRDESGVARVVRLGLDGRTGRWLGPRVRLRYDANDHSNVDLDADGFVRPGIDLLLAGAPVGAGLAGIVTALALWRRRYAILGSERPVVVVCSAAVVGGVVLASGLAAWAVGTVGERGWSGVGTSMGDAVATVFAEFLGVLIPVVTFVIGCVLTAWLARHRSRLDHGGVLAEAYGLLHRAAAVVPSPDELRSDEAPDEAPEVASTPELTGRGGRRVDRLT
jgi:hypothetical protein